MAGSRSRMWSSMWWRNPSRTSASRTIQKSHEPSILGAPVSLLEKLLLNADHDHGTIDITYPNNVFIQFVIEGNSIKLETQFGLGEHGENVRYIVSFAADQSGDGSLLKGADGQVLFSGGLTALDFNDAAAPYKATEAAHHAHIEVAVIAVPEPQPGYGIVIPFNGFIPQGVSFSQQLSALRDRFDLEADALLQQFAAVA